MTTFFTKKLLDSENSKDYSIQEEDLFQLVRENDLEKTKDYIKLNHLIDINISELRDSRGNSLLHYACANGFEELASFLLSYVDSCRASLIDSQNNEGNTALHWTALNNQIIIAKMLLANGADASIKNVFNYLAFDEAEMRGFTELSSILLNKTKLDNC